MNQLAGGGIAGAVLALGSFVLERSYPRAQGADSRTAEGPGKSGYSSTHATSMAVSCNEVPRNGDVAGFIGTIGSLVIGR